MRESLTRSSASNTLPMTVDDTGFLLDRLMLALQHLVADPQHAERLLVPAGDVLAVEVLRVKRVDPDEEVDLRVVYVVAGDDRIGNQPNRRITQRDDLS